MIISNDEARIRAWIKLQQERSEGIIQLTSGDVKKLLEIINILRHEIFILEAHFPHHDKTQTTE